ncbi:MAG: tetratricopeptide repeat protein [Candidatus Aminicenantaceae bacterium]
MKMSLLKEKGFSPLFFILILLLSCGAFITTELKIERISRKKIPGSSIIYIPSGKYLKYATFGYSSLLADLIYIWAIQYYSDTSIEERFKYLDHIFSIISELDPHYLDPYEVGAVIALYEAKNPDLSLQILDSGLAKNPQQWIFPFEAGHYAQLVIKDYKLAQHHYRRAMEIDGSPPIAKRLYANAAFKVMDFQTSWRTWLEILQTTKDERIKKIASNHLYQVKAAIDIDIITNAIQKFRERYQRNPIELSHLVRAGFLESLPKDLDGQEYLYDPSKGEAKPPTIPWKR